MLKKFCAVAMSSFASRKTETIEVSLRVMENLSSVDDKHWSFHSETLSDLSESRYTGRRVSGISKFNHLQVNEDFEVDIGSSFSISSTVTLSILRQPNNLARVICSCSI